PKAPVVNDAIDTHDAPDRPAKILLVDDDVLIAMSTADMLVDLGHEVVEANSGEDALSALSRDGGFDLMITDFSMPGMNGAQLAKRVQKIMPDLPIILATGYAEMPAGVEMNVPRLSKPYSQIDLKREITRLLGAQ
ncbi:MAG: response regulator, partial [Burkholderiales bacterium]